MVVSVASSYTSILIMLCDLDGKVDCMPEASAMRQFCVADVKDNGKKLLEMYVYKCKYV